MSNQTNLRQQFLLDPAVTFLNHGSFGATPKPVFEAYQAWQRRLERQPVHFLATELPQLLAEARATLAAFIHAEPDNLVYIPNATFGVNIVARSIPLGPDDEVLTTDHEYGACNNVWTYLAQKQGFLYKQQPISLPLDSDENIINQLWQGVTPRTKVIFISHITSATAVTMPIAAICAKARAAGIITVIDGAHAVGQIPLNLANINADYYLSNAHKWLCAPKSAAFLHVQPSHHAQLEPLIVGWGWGEHKQFTFGNNLLDYNQWLGTTDQSAYLSVPTAIQFQHAHQWPTIQSRCHHNLKETLAQLHHTLGTTSIYQSPHFYHQMAVAQLPANTDVDDLKTTLYQKNHIEIPCIRWQDKAFIRLSVQGYNTTADLAHLHHALQTYFA